ncbi:hypothetical protein BR10RB9215_C10201 [Brucella sp. 10RB9215]|nr:hypothetical protein BR10RB9215_C10201 [Brucella sp. 10RB9215]
MVLEHEAEHALWWAAVSSIAAKTDCPAHTLIAMKVEIRRVFNENFQAYGVCKVRRQLLREGYDIARGTVARLMRDIGLQGIIRGKPVKTTASDKAAPCPLDRVTGTSMHRHQTCSGFLILRM